MRISYFFFAAIVFPILGGGLSGCAPITSLASSPKIESAPPMFSLLDLGRRLSDGGVDIFDPWVPTLTIPDLPEKPHGIQFNIPKHESMIIRDPRVTVYSLLGFGEIFSSEPEIDEPPEMLMDTPSLTGVDRGGMIEEEVLPP